MTLLPRNEAIVYLGISLELFEFYDSKSLIRYKLVNLERRYDTRVLDQFKLEVLDGASNK